MRVRAWPVLIVAVSLLINAASLKMCWDAMDALRAALMACRQNEAVIAQKIEQLADAMGVPSKAPGHGP